MLGIARSAPDAERGAPLSVSGTANGPARSFAHLRAAGASPKATWMAAGAKRGTLMYVSNANDGTVSVLSYPRGDLVGTLTGFKEPYGLCSDAAGDVWIVDDETATITEYAHGAASPEATVE